jgi:SAM-dependent methyltransferase
MTPPAADAAARQRALLHQGGTAGDWGNLGLWTADPADYAGACRALASAVGRAAGLQPGDRVLSLACGAGEELRLWTDAFGAAAVLGVEIDPAAAAVARAACAGDPRIGVLCRPALVGGELPASADGAPFDAVVCVDAAYHLSPRRALLAAACQRLRPGGRLAYGDLSLRAGGTRPSAGLRAAARLCGVPADDLLPLDSQVQRLQQLGFTDVRAQVLDEAVLGGFVRFVRRQAAAQELRPWQTGWRAVATTAALVPPCRAAGLGYALLSATWPGPSGPTGPSGLAGSSRAATA